MSESQECLAARAALGPLLLGRLTPAEEARARAHVAACPHCATDLAELEPVVALLGRVDPDTLAEDDELLDYRSLSDEQAEAWSPALVPAAPAHLRESVLDALGREDELRRRRRRRALLAAPMAAAAAVVALLLVIGLPGSSAPQERHLASVGGSQATATVHFVTTARTTEIRMDAWGLVDGRRYGLWLERHDGTRVGAGTWTAWGPTCHLELTAKLPLDEAAAVGFTTLDDHKDVARAAL
ncbi:anti-sigma factor family protein [Motilibacter peucedani]|nr:zf-HC2 domain-containing protein [Motilibacter peucedani]